MVSQRAGGDWGSAITTVLGALHSEHCKAIHINLLIASPSLLNPWHLAQVLTTLLKEGSIPYYYYCYYTLLLP